MRHPHTLPRQQLRELETELRSERRRLERVMEADAESDASVSDGGVAVETLMATAVGGLLQTRAHARYDAILDALNRLAAGTYGTCVGCNRPIPYGRLIVLPEALHCVSCGSRG